MIFNRITPEEAARLGYIHEVEDDLIDSEDDLIDSDDDFIDSDDFIGYEDDLDELENYTSDEEEYNLYTINRNVGDNKWEMQYVPYIVCSAATLTN